MRSTRRLTRLLIVLAVLATPAAAMRVACVDRACDESKPAPAIQVPFCSLPSEIRDLVVNGYRNERSPDVLAITASPSISGQVPPGPTGAAPEWPSLLSPTATQVPVAISGPGIPRRAADIRLDAVAPTIAKALGVDWQFPNYRTGIALEGTTNAGAQLAILIAWKGVGTAEVGSTLAEAPAGLRSLLHRGSGSLTGSTGSLPVDSSAAITTVGAGALPRVHGITGTILHNDAHEVVEAWSKSSPYEVVNSLGDSMDAASKGESRIGLVATEPFDRGLIGGTWFEGIDDTWSNDDRVEIVRPGAVGKAATDLVSSDFGGGQPSDGVPDLIGVTLEGSPRQMDAATRAIVATADRASSGEAIIAVFGTGSAAAPAETEQFTAADIDERASRALGADVIQALVPGGLFLDRDVMAEAVITSGGVVNAIESMHQPGEPKVMADVFPAFAITLARFC